MLAVANSAYVTPPKFGVIFPDIELAVCNVLRNQSLGGIRVGNKVPTTRPSEFIRVLRTGGVMETIRSEAAQVTVEAWAQTEFRASAILAICRAIINRSEGIVFGAKELSGPINLPDPSTAQIRYTMSFQIRARGAAITV